jgi:hypothetical protein
MLLGRFAARAGGGGVTETAAIREMISMHSTATLFCAVVLFASLYIILFRPEDREAREWAFVIVGLILGYWLKWIETDLRLSS